MKSYRNSNLARSAEDLHKYKTTKRVAIALFGLLAVLLVDAYLLVSLYNLFGSFTISVKKLEMVRYGLTLSESPTTDKQNSRLNAPALADSVESRADWIDGIKEIDSTDGSHNGDNYFAYTFYCVNNSTDYLLTYSYSLVVKNVTLDLDEAIRIRLYVNGEEIGTYGKQEPDGSTPLRDYEWNRRLDETTGEYIYDRSPSNLINKYSGDTVVSGEIVDLAPGESTRFTVVMWIEGTDPECTDDKMGGNMRLDMVMSVVHPTEIKK